MCSWSNLTLVKWKPSASGEYHSFSFAHTTKGNGQALAHRFHIAFLQSPYVKEIRQPGIPGFGGKNPVLLRSKEMVGDVQIHAHDSLHINGAPRKRWKKGNMQSVHAVPTNGKT